MNTYESKQKQLFVSQIEAYNKLSDLKNNLTFKMFQYVDNCQRLVKNTVMCGENVR